MKEWIITSCLLMIAVLTLRWCFVRKISAKLRYALWGFVLVRLLIPVSLFESDISVMNLAASAPPVSAPIWKGQQAFQNDFAMPYIGESTNAFIDDYETYIEPQALTETPPPPISWINIAKWIWVLGAAISGLWFMGVNLLFYYRLRKTRVRLEIEAKVPVYIAQGIASPCLFGVPCPAIYITSQAAAHPYLAEHILAHEQCHKQHGDHIWSVLRGVCLALWWWNPLVWVCAYLSNKDAEIACDEAVIGKIGEKNRLAYGYTLVDMVGAKQGAAGLMCAATTMAAGKKEIAERIKRIVKRQKTALWAAGAVILILAIVAGCTFTGAKDTPDDDELDPLAQQLQVLEEYNNRFPRYDYRVLSYGSTLSGGTSLTGEKEALAEEIILNFLQGANKAAPGVEIVDYPECYRITVQYQNGDSVVAYVYLKDGQPMIQLGEDGLMAAELNPDLYARLIAGVWVLANDVSQMEKLTLEEMKKFGREMYGEEGIHVPVCTILDVKTQGDTRTVYAMATYMVFESDGLRLTSKEGFYRSAALTFEQTLMGYKLLDVNIPSFGSIDYSLAEIFPDEVRQNMRDLEDYATSNSQKAYMRAYIQAKISPYAAIEEHLAALETSLPTFGAHYWEYSSDYNNLLYHGQYTLRYAFNAVLDGSSNDRKAYILIELMRDLLGAEMEGTPGDTPQEIFDNWKEKAKSGWRPGDRTQTGANLLMQVLEERQK